MTRPATERLQAFAAAVGNSDQAEALGLLRRWLSEDLSALETKLMNGGEGRAEAVAAPLLAAGGKRIRPLCLLVASKLQSPQHNEKAQDLAAVVELIHNATLLHDDVIDQAGERRGQPTARVLHGNTVSVFAGDWLLIRALRIIHRVGETWALPMALDCIDELIEAEILQAELSRELLVDPERYLEVIDGKTASLFRLALNYGGSLAQLTETERLHLEAFGTHLGLAFQIQDDLLDLIGDPSQMGKPLLSDLAEGRLTLPLLWLLQSQPEWTRTVEGLAHQPANEMPESERRALIQALHESGGIQGAQAMVSDEISEALQALEQLPNGLAKEALNLMAQLLMERRA